MFTSGRSRSPLGMSEFTLSSKQTLKFISDGYEFSVAITEDGMISTSGVNRYLALGSGIDDENYQSNEFTIVGVVDANGKRISFLYVDAGSYHACAISENFKLYCWGSNLDNQIVDGPKLYAKPTLVKIEQVQLISCGATFTVASSNNKTFSWGSNEHYRLGLNDTDNRKVPTILTSPPFKQIKAGHNFALALTFDDTLYAWGTINETEYRVPSYYVRRVKDFDVDYDNFVFLTHDFKIFYFFTRKMKNFTEFIPSDELGNTTQIMISQDGFFILNQKGVVHRIYLTGSRVSRTGNIQGTYSQMMAVTTEVGDRAILYATSQQNTIMRSRYATLQSGAPFIKQNITYYNITNFTDIKDIRIASEESRILDPEVIYMLLIDGRVLLIETNEGKELEGRFKKITTAGYAINLKNCIVSFGITNKGWENCEHEYMDVGASYIYDGVNSRYIAILSNGSLCIQSNKSTSCDVISIYGINDEFESIDSGVAHSVLITKSGRLFTTGDNYYGQLGIGSLKSNFNRVSEIMIGTKFNYVRCYKNATIALTVDGRVYFWGYFTRNTVPITKPIPIVYQEDTNKQFKSVSIGREHAVAISVDDDIYVYGYNSFGQFGNDLKSSSELIFSKEPLYYNVTAAFAVGYTTYSFMRCNEGRYGENCSLSKCEPDCGKNGTCVGLNKCECLPNYKRGNNSKRCVVACFGLDAEDVNACGGQQNKCVGINNCKCYYAAISIPDAACTPDAIKIYAIIFSLLTTVVLIICSIIISYFCYGAAKRRKQYKRLVKHTDSLTVELLDKDLQIQEIRHDWLIKYEELDIQNKIGKGSFGTVFKGGYHGSSVAIKLIQSNQSSDEQALEREIKIMMKLFHPNIVQFLGVCLVEKASLIVTELMDGGSLEEIIFGRRKISIKKKVLLLRDVSSGMSYLHNKEPPLIHRDLKPHNILVDKDVTCAKVCDFGISKFCEGPDRNTKGRVGTNGFIAPEVLDGENYNMSCDVYSFGIVMYEVYYEVHAYSLDQYNEKNVISGSLRPKLDAGIFKLHPEYAKLMVSCWDPDSSARPNFSLIQQRFGEILEGLQ
ncbi:serine/threonine-protein kinase CTR1 [Acrasis kona]|uniref:Serine/threonine-protein kinase CTR1 n=1 Tax=Acrasis kona TaxID=1008807 RepID=A0AAW2Z537_9EUKA